MKSLQQDKKCIANRFVNRIPFFLLDRYSLDASIITSVEVVSKVCWLFV